MGNLLDHRNKMDTLKDICRISKTDPTYVFPKINYDQMTKPPITYYIPIQVINQLYNIIHDPRMMARPSRKYKMMNDLLRPLGIKHLASGTNRRSFYCEYDDTIVFKIGIDSIGEEANLMEFKSQHLLKPFCAKMFDVTQTGTIALSERVDTMTESEYKLVYRDQIFDLIFIMLNRGFIMEDVGANFYKNWGVRYGFGPVVLDYPYVFEVDWSKLKCTKRDPITGDKCLGDLDYNYDKGMSEIICKKCGARYTAKHLAKSSYMNGMTQINTGGNKTMPLINTNIKVAIRKNGKIVKRFYAEDEVKRDPQRTISGDPNIITTNLSSNTTLGSAVADKATKIGQELIKKANTIYKVKPVENVVTATTHEKEYHFYPKDIKNDIIYFLRRVESKHGSDVALELADKLQVKFYTSSEYKEKFKKEKDEWKERNRLNSNGFYFKTGCEEPESEEKKEGDSEEDKKEESSNEYKATIIEDEEKPKTVINKVDHETAMSEANKIISSIPDLLVKPVVIGKDKKDDDKEKSVTSEVDENRQKTGLFPTKPMTAEEIEAADLKRRNENAVMGFPGEPLVDQMKFKEMMPRIQSMVHVKFNNFKTVTNDTTEICEELSMNIKNFIMEDIKSLTNDVEALNVEVTKTVDERNNDCYKVVATNRGSALFDTTIYPISEEYEFNLNDIEKRFEDLMKNKKELEEFFNKVAENIDFDKYSKLPPDEARSSIIAQLYVSLYGRKEHNDEKEPYAASFKAAREAATDYVDRHFQFDEKTVNEEEEKKEEENTTADEL